MPFSGGQDSEKDGYTFTKHLCIPGEVVQRMDGDKQVEMFYTDFRETFGLAKYSVLPIRLDLHGTQRKICKIILYRSRR